MLPKANSLSGRLCLIEMVGHRESVGTGLVSEECDQRQLVLPVATTIFAGQTGNHPVQEVPDWLRISKSHY